MAIYFNNQKSLHIIFKQNTFLFSFWGFGGRMWMDCKGRGPGFDSWHGAEKIYSWN